MTIGKYLLRSLAIHLATIGTLIFLFWFANERWPVGWHFGWLFVLLVVFGGFIFSFSDLIKAKRIIKRKSDWICLTVTAMAQIISVVFFMVVAFCFCLYYLGFGR